MPVGAGARGRPRPGAPRRSTLVAVLELDVTAPSWPRAPPLALAPVRTSTPRSRSASATCSPANGSSLGSSRSSPRRARPRHRGFARPAPARRRPARRRGRSGCPGPASRSSPARLSQGFASREPVDRRNRAPDAGGDHDRLARHEHVVADLHPPLAVERPSPRNSSIPRSSSQGSWPESSRSWITSSRRSSAASDVELAGHRLGGARHPPHLGEHLGRAQQRLRRHARVVRALAADQVRLDDRHLQAAVGEPPRADLARWPAPITMASNSRSLIPLHFLNLPLPQLHTETLPALDCRDRATTQLRFSPSPPRGSHAPAVQARDRSAATWCASPCIRRLLRDQPHVLLPGQRHLGTVDRGSLHDVPLTHARSVPQPLSISAITHSFSLALSLPQAAKHYGGFDSFPQHVLGDLRLCPVEPRDQGAAVFSMPRSSHLESQ